MLSSSSSSGNSAVGLKRLQKEYIAIQKQPVENITTRPDEKNIFEWHYCIKGPNDSCYKDGYYYGILRFPNEYPFKPPSIMMITPNGRFKTNTRLCLSMSDFHPETWNPMWSVSSILSGLLSFMLDDAPTHGSMTATTEQRQLLARTSMESNIKNIQFVKHFPEIVSEYRSKPRNSRGESIILENSEDEIRNKLSNTSEKEEEKDKNVPTETIQSEDAAKKLTNDNKNVVVGKEKKKGGAYFTVLLLSFAIAVASFFWHQHQQLLSLSNADSNFLQDKNS